MRGGRGDTLRFGLALMFVVGVMFYALMNGSGRGDVLTVIAAALGCYVAMNIGANDVANNVGPAVGARALSLAGALAIAAVFEAAGALIGGGDVIATVSSGIIDPSHIADPDVFVRVMMAALLAGGLWINLATALGAPVSTTHSIVGAVLGAGMAASGPGIANWSTVASIVASWVVSPLMGGAIAAAFLMLLKRGITWQADMVAAALRVVPALVALMAWLSASFLLLEGLNRVWAIGFPAAMLAGAVVAVPVFWLTRRRLARRCHLIGNTLSGVNKLFNVPLACAAALLSFAHGSNDVANAVGPLAAIVDALARGADGSAVATPVPQWVMMVGALGISVGLALFGARVIRTLGSEITELDPMRAFCVAMSAVLTVLTASQLGLPVSTTHIAVGGVFGVGFLREYLKRNHARVMVQIKAQHPEGDQQAIDDFLGRFARATVTEKKDMLAALKAQSKMNADPANFSKKERKGLREVYRQELVARTALMQIVAAWVLTLPASAVMGSGLFFLMQGIAAE